jgi:oligoendopeptidase F
MQSTMTSNGAEAVVWDLADLYPSTDDPTFRKDITTIVERTQTFRSTWSGRFGTATDDEMLSFINEYSDLLETLDRLGSYAHLRWSTDTEDPENGSVLQSIRETSSQAWTWLVFVGIELCALDDARIDHFMTCQTLAPWKHWFENVRKSHPHMLSEEIEQVLSQKSLTSRYAWVRLHDEMQNAQTFTLNGHEYTEAAILKMLHEPDRATRKAAAESFSTGLKQGVKSQAFIFNTVMADHALNDRLRNYPTWVSSRNEANEVSDASVQALIDGVVDRYDLVRRFYALKKRILGLDVMYDYDRYAPVGGDQGHWSWAEAREIVVKAYSDFHPEAGAIADMFFERPWIHAPVLKGKSGGAYSAGTVPSAHPYVFLNYTGTNRDVQVLAHELGHGIHQYLSRRNGMLLADTPLTIAETASVFGEMLVFRTLLDRTPSKQERLALLMAKIDDMIATVFRQISLNRFEEAMHLARRSEGELSVDRLSDLWLSTQGASFGDSVTLTDGYRYWWSYISHFMHTPGYVYAYAFGELLVLALHQKYQEEGEAFPEKYMDLLRAGGSKAPEALLAPFGFDINDASFWSIGLTAIERLIDEAEALAV